MADIKYSKDHTWVAIDGDVAKIGITPYAVEQLGDIVFVDLPEEGDEITKGETFTEIESSKTASEVPAPVSGEIVAVNADLDDEPESINDDALAAWIVEVKLTDDDTSDLLDSSEYDAICE